MFGLVRTAVRFFFIGFATGVLLAPRAGAETRALIRERLQELADGVLEIASFPPSDEGATATGEGAATSGARRGRIRRAAGSGAASPS
ncbi:MAG TPA: YtxH domain-containing protein [Candidatus Limnocylindria bacterium]|nr:YtxH domain-containing protein [Candidatus Limnocylindria bacterium]